MFVALNDRVFGDVDLDGTFVWLSRLVRGLSLGRWLAILTPLLGSGWLPLPIVAWTNVARTNDRVRLTDSGLLGTPATIAMR
jgi:hypothetical protein